MLRVENRIPIKYYKTGLKPNHYIANIQIIFAMPTIFYVSKLIIPLYQSLLYRTPWNQNIKNKNNCGLYAENAYFCPKGQ